MLARAAIGAFCATALISGGVAPVVASNAAHDTGDEDVVKVTVCKKVKDDTDEDKKFKFEAKTDKDSLDFKLADGFCRKFELEFKENKLTVEEDVKKNYDVTFKVRGDIEKVVVSDTKVRVKFDDSEDKPRVRITVVNKKTDDDD
jgi:hypothetical protein